MIQDCLSVEGRPPAFCTYLRSYDLDFDLTTLILHRDLDIMKICFRTENEVCRSRQSEVRARTGQTDRQTGATERITTVAAFAGRK